MLTCEKRELMASGGTCSFMEQNKPGAFLYRLDPTQSDILTKHWQPAYELACKLKDNPDEVPLHLQIGALRYSSSFEKTTNEDQLIDCIIALEALFTKENDALSYRLPLRAAVFTSDTPEDREHVFRLLKVAYDLRSKLAHGQKRLEDTAKLAGHKIPMTDFVEQLRSAHLHGFAFNYPESWQVQANNNTSVTIAPASARTTTKSGKSWLREGLIAGVGQPRSGGLDNVADALFQNFKKSNPYALRVGTMQTLRVAGHNAVITEFSNHDPDAPSPSGNESGLIAAISGDSGQVAYLVMFCSDRETWFPTFRRIILGVAFDTEATAPATTPPVSHVYVEPWQTLVHDTVSVNAGQAVEYNF